MMSEKPESGKPKAGIANILLIWAIGLALGGAVGAATALLLMPHHGDAALPARHSLNISD